MDVNGARRGLVSVAGEIGSADALLAHDLNVRIILLNRVLEAVQALAGDEEVSRVEDQADFAFSLQRLGHEVGSRDAVAIVVRRDDTDILFACSKSLQEHCP